MPAAFTSLRWRCAAGSVCSEQYTSLVPLPATREYCSKRNAKSNCFIALIFLPMYN